MSILTTKTKGRIYGRKGVLSILGKAIFACLSVAWCGFNAYASGIPSGTSSPTCDYGTLESYTGPVGLQAQYDPNEIELHWYNENEEMTVQAAAETCTYDAVLNVPNPPPTRVGYDFAGWTLRE